MTLLKSLPMRAYAFLHNTEETECSLDKMEISSLSLHGVTFVSKKTHVVPAKANREAYTVCDITVADANGRLHDITLFSS